MPHLQILMIYYPQTIVLKEMKLINLWALVLMYPNMYIHLNFQNFVFERADRMLQRSLSEKIVVKTKR